MDIKEKIELIKRNCQEIVTEKELEDLLKKKKKPSVYLGTAITGTPHIGYFVWVSKMADFLKAGFKVKVLLSDITGALDNTPWEVLDKRYKYYENVIPLMFESVGVDTNDLEFVKSSDINLSKEYYLDLLKLSTITSLHDANKAASEVVKLGDNPKLSGMIYPLIQTLDEQYLDVDVQYAGVDQRKIMMFARENLPKIGYEKRVEVMTPMIPGLIGKKMSASDAKSKVDLLDDEKTVIEKVKGAEMVTGDPDNGVMAFLRYVIMVRKEDAKEKFVIKRPEKYGGDLEYSSYDEVEKDFAASKIHPLDLKNAVADEINDLLKPFRKNSKKLTELAKKAYE